MQVQQLQLCQSSQLQQLRACASDCCMQAGQLRDCTGQRSYLQQRRYNQEKEGLHGVFERLHRKGNQLKEWKLPTAQQTEPSTKASASTAAIMMLHLRPNAQN
jgi:hypothetical protein